jgi:Transglutaminase-like superfamily
MCFDATAVGGLSRWNWDGDAVVFETAVPSQRPVVGGRRHYRIDVREFILSQNNAVVRDHIKEKLRPFADTIKKRGGALFEDRSRGAFDFRALVVERWVAENIRRETKQGRDPWQFPDETLTIRRGDCEDLAFLIASLLLGSGVSGYHVRVALGEVRVGSERYDHAWVVYKNESGRWQLIEPFRRPAAAARQRGRRRGERAPKLLPGPVRYVPSFLFNDAHLWVVVRRGNPASLERIAARRWNRMTPKFAGDVHLSILERALFDAPEFLERVRARFRRLALVGPLIDPDDWIDVLNPSSTPYDPRQHFDNGLIEESWDLLEGNAATFRRDRDDVDAFGKAAHAIADFYAHSSYLAFAWSTSGATQQATRLYHPESWNDDDHLHDAPSYGPGPTPELGRFDLHRFSQNRTIFKSSVDEGIARWDGRILSGRYAQSRSDHLGSAISKLAESMCELPEKYKRPEIGAVPHHSEIAVDDADWSSEHRLFEPGEYALQYQRRVNTAVMHVRKLWETGVP